MDIGKELIEKIERLVEDRYVVKVEDRMYSAANLRPVMYVPRPQTLTVHNLRGFCGFINNDIDKNIAGKPMLIVVDSPESVRLISENNGEDLRRTVLVEAVIADCLETFPFGKFMPQEEFAIAFRSLFVRDEAEKDDFDYVLSYSSRLAGGTQIDGSDDGITQEVQVKRGVSGALTKKESLKAIVKLSPYRTFREVKQPQSEFLLRVRLNQNDVPTVALFEADGGNWINQATENIVNYIQSLVDDIPVIA
jgi:hypothetical protein